MAREYIGKYIRWLNPYNPTRSYFLDRMQLSKPLVRAVGHHLYDAEGVEYLDFLSQYGAVSFGHNHPELWAALAACAQEQLPAMIQPLVPVAAQQLAAKLAAVTPGDLGITVFTNSGAEAVEAAIKLARARTGRPTILSTINGFHGKTLGALSATGNPTYQVLFGAPLPHFDYVPYGDAAALEAVLEKDADQIAAFILEPIQGEAGVIPAPPGYLAKALELCRRYGVLSIVDEIQTGLGRTGALFGLPAEAGAPDILVLAKALGGGLVPIGACITTPDAWDHRFGALHSSTFANGNLVARVGLCALDILLRDDQQIVRHVAKNGAYLLQRLRELQAAYPRVIRDVRGAGYLAGLEFFPFDGDDSYTMAFFSKNDYLVAFFASYLFNVHHLVTAPVFNNSHVLRLEPPFTVGPPEIDRAMAALGTLCDTLDRKDYYHLVRHLPGEAVTRAPGHRRFAAPNAPNPVPTPSQSVGPRKSFAFLVHYTELRDYVACDPSFTQFTAEELDRWRDWVQWSEPGLVYNVSKGAQSLVGKGIAVTSGNVLTTVMALEGIADVTSRLGLSLPTMHTAVVGATGAIGRLASLLLADRVAGLTLIGNPRSRDALVRCRIVAGEIYARLIGRAKVTPPRAASPIDQQLREVLQPLLTTPLLRLTAAEVPLARVLHEQREVDDDGGYERLARAVETAFASAGREAPITFATDLRKSEPAAELVFVATNSDASLIAADALTPGAVVCDVARPPNVAREVVESRDDVLVFEGGLVEFPEPVHFGPNLLGFRPGIMLGCLAETVLLALEGDDRDHSIGPRLDPAEAEYLRVLAERHGVRAAPPHCCGVELSEEDFAKRRRAHAALRVGLAVDKGDLATGRLVTGGSA